MDVGKCEAWTSKIHLFLFNAVFVSHIIKVSIKS